MDLNKKALEAQERLRSTVQDPANASAVVTVRIAGFKFQAVAQGANRTAYYVDGVRATKAQQVQALELALAKEQAQKPEVVTDPAQLKGLPPGTYTVAGAAAAQVLYQGAQDVVASHERQQLVKSRQRHLLRSRQAHAAYRMSLTTALLQITKHYGAEVRISAGVARVLAWPKRPAVVNRLKHLIKIHNTLAH